MPFTSRRDITRTSSTLFIANALNAIEGRFGFGIDGLAKAKFRIVEALIKVIAIQREVRQETAFQHALLPQSGLDFETSADLELVLEESRYAYRQPYRGGTAFRKHLFRVIGDLESSGEEFDCAVYIERLDAVKAWVRNAAQQAYSFWLQTSSDKFYPDFLAFLNDGRVLAIEY